MGDSVNVPTSVPSGVSVSDTVQLAGRNVAHVMASDSSIGVAPLVGDSGRNGASLGSPVPPILVSPSDAALGTVDTVSAAVSNAEVAAGSAPSAVNEWDASEAFSWFDILAGSSV